MRVCAAQKAGPDFRISRAVRRAGFAAFALIAGSAGLTHGAAAETRTISLHHVHTDENLTITFKRDGQYDEKALEKINWIMRDWRKNQAIKMDPQEIDLLWEVYQDVGAKEPIYIICGYRSPDTNNMLRRRSKGVAKFSQHTLGKAIDFYIPGVPLDRLRAAAMKAQGGGVGYYPTSGSPFVHLDIGNVRAWPRMTREQLVKLFPDGRTVHVPSDGTPLAGYQLALADVERGNRTAAPPTKQRNLFARLFGGSQDAEESDDNASARQTTPAPRRAQEAKPAAPARVQVASAAPSDLKPEAKAETKPAAPARTQVAAAAPENVPLPPVRPIYQVASAESRPVPAPARRSLGTVEVASLTANDVISSRGFWDGLDAPPRPPADVPDANLDNARRELAAGLLAGNRNDLTASTGPFARPDRVPPELALAYAVQGDPKAAAPAPVARPVGVPAVVTRKGSGTVAVKPTETIARSTPVKANPMNDPWIRGVALAPSVQDSMTVTRFGDPDYARLAEFMQKPRSAVVMNFSYDPQLGMTDKSFTGSAVVFQATVSFPDQRTAALQ